MKILHHELALVAVAVMLSGCSFTSITNPRLDMAKFLVPGVKSKEADYRARAMEFIDAAKNGDVDKMMEMTSLISCEASGTDFVRMVYRDDVVPQFQKVSVVWNTKGEIIIDETYNVGFCFSGKAVGEKTFPFYLDVMEENQTLVILNIRKTRKPVKANDGAAILTTGRLGDANRLQTYPSEFSLPWFLAGFLFGWLVYSVNP